MRRTLATAEFRELVRRFPARPRRRRAAQPVHARPSSPTARTARSPISTASTSAAPGAGGSSPPALEPELAELARAHRRRASRRQPSPCRRRLYGRALARHLRPAGAQAYSERSECGCSVRASMHPPARGDAACSSEETDRRRDRLARRVRRGSIRQGQAERRSRLQRRAAYRLLQRQSPRSRIGKTIYFKAAITGRFRRPTRANARTLPARDDPCLAVSGAWAWPRFFLRYGARSCLPVSAAERHVPIRAGETRFGEAHAGGPGADGRRLSSGEEPAATRRAPLAREEPEGQRPLRAVGYDPLPAKARTWR